MAVTLQDRLEEATADLNACASANEVAAIVRREKAFGQPGLCGACPIAVLVERRIGPASVEVDGQTITVVGEFGDAAVVPLTFGPKSFIDHFDLHEYEDLELPSAECAVEDCWKHSEVAE